MVEPRRLRLCRQMEMDRGAEVGLDTEKDAANTTTT